VNIHCGGMKRKAGYLYYFVGLKKTKKAPGKRSWCCLLGPNQERMSRPEVESGQGLGLDLVTVYYSGEDGNLGRRGGKGDGERSGCVFIGLRGKQTISRLHASVPIDPIYYVYGIRSRLLSVPAIPFP
jgi:hypothetical protein